jgi:Family of unknown function (DUF6188)
MGELDFLVGEVVVEVHDRDRIVFEAGVKPEPRLYADVGPFLCADSEGTPLPVAALVGRTVASASATDGILSLTFADGATLRCEPSAEYEAWQVVGGSPENLVVCMPGGELAVWDDRTPSIPLAQLRERDPAAASALDEMLKQFDLPRPTGFPPEADKA